MNTETLGAKIIIRETAKIGKAPATINLAVNTEKPTDFYEVIVGIGKDHTAHLYLDEHALVELRKENPVKRLESEMEIILNRGERDMFDAGLISGLSKAIGIVNESMMKHHPNLKIITSIEIEPNEFRLFCNDCAWIVQQKEKIIIRLNLEKERYEFESTCPVCGKKIFNIKERY